MLVGGTVCAAAISWSACARVSALGAEAHGGAWTPSSAGSPYSELTLVDPSAFNVRISMSSMADTPTPRR